MTEVEAGGEEAAVTAIWTLAEPNDMVFAEVLEILFGPDDDAMAA